MIMKKTEFETFKMLLADRKQKIKVLNICESSRIVYEGIADDAPVTDWEVLSIYIKDDFLIIEVC